MMKSQPRCQKLAITQAYIALVLLVSVVSASHWPTSELFDRHYHNVAPLISEIASTSAPNTNNGSVSPGSTAETAVISSKNLGTRRLKPRWSNHRRLSAREAVAVMEKELQRREAAKSINTPVKSTEDIKPAATNVDSAAAPANRRSGHHMGVTGPVHTFVKTDRHGHYKWGVRHHANHGFSR